MPLHLKRSDVSSVCLPSILSPRRSATDICISLNFTPPLYFCCCVIWDQRKRYESLQQLGIEGNTPSSRCDKKEEWNLSASFLKSMSIIHWDNLHLPGRRGVSLLTQLPVLTGVWCGLCYCTMWCSVLIVRLSMSGPSPALTGRWLILGLDALSSGNTAPTHLPTVGGCHDS